MALTLKLSKWGHSYGIRLPRTLLKLIDVDPDKDVTFNVECKRHQLILKVANK